MAARTRCGFVSLRADLDHVGEPAIAGLIDIIASLLKKHGICSYARQGVGTDRSRDDPMIRTRQFPIHHRPGAYICCRGDLQHGRHEAASSGLTADGVHGSSKHDQDHQASPVTTI